MRSQWVCFGIRFWFIIWPTNTKDIDRSISLFLCWDLKIFKETSISRSLHTLIKLYLHLTLSWRWALSYSKQSIDLRSKLMGWFLYDNGLRHERVKVFIVSAHFPILVDSTFPAKSQEVQVTEGNKKQVNIYFLVLAFLYLYMITKNKQKTYCFINNYDGIKEFKCISSKNP